MARTKMTEEQKVLAAKLRKIKKENERREAEERLAKLENEWESEKREKWLEMIVRIQRLHNLVYTDMGYINEDVVSGEHHWFFDCGAFSVDDCDDILLYRIRTYERSSNGFNDFNRYTYGGLEGDIDQAYEYIADTKRQRDIERKKAEELANKRLQALSKLSAEDRKVLGV